VIRIIVGFLKIISNTILVWLSGESREFSTLSINHNSVILTPSWLKEWKNIEVLIKLIEGEHWSLLLIVDHIVSSSRTISSSIDVALNGTSKSIDIRALEHHVSVGDSNVAESTWDLGTSSISIESIDTNSLNNWIVYMVPDLVLSNSSL
jgi:hypothetical protein